jgi:hypothetical protein
VLSDPTFKQNVTRVSKILKESRPLETVEAAIVAEQPNRSAVDQETTQLSPP